MFIETLRLVGQLVQPSVVLTTLVLLAALAGLLRRWRIALWFQSAAIVIVVLLGVFPGGSWLAVPLERRFQSNPPLPAHVDGIIALGGTESVTRSAVWGQPILSDASPIVALLALARRYPDAKLVFSGGNHPRDSLAPTEADVVRNFIHALNIDDSRVLYEARSQNTLQNAVFSRDMVRPAAEERWILVTEAISMPRAVGVFRHAGWDVVPYPAGYLTNGNRGVGGLFNLGDQLRLASLAIHEWGGLFIYRVMGYTGELFPS